MKNKTVLADFGMLFITIIWGFSFNITKVVAGYYTPSQILFYRFLIGSVIFAAIFYKDLRKISKKDIQNGVLLGLFLFLGHIAQTYAINYTTVAKNAFLTTLYIIFVPLLSALVYKERVDKYGVISCILALIGTGILSLNLDLTINFGDILSIACAIFFSLHIFYQGVYVKETKTTTLITIQFITSCVLSLFASAFTGGIILNEFGLIGIMGIAYLAIFVTCISFFIQAVCQKYASPVKVVVIFSLEAVFASVISVLLFDGIMTARLLIGSSIIFAAVIISTTKLSFLPVMRRQKILTKES